MADGFALLDDAHRSIERQFEKYLDAHEEPIARAIRDALGEHAALEEAVLYPTLRRDVSGGDERLGDEMARPERQQFWSSGERPVLDHPTLDRVDVLVNLCLPVRERAQHHLDQVDAALPCSAAYRGSGRDRPCGLRSARPTRPLPADEHLVR
jgi:hypothetical protein